MKHIKNIVTGLLCGILLFGFSAFAWIRAPHAYSNAERRSLAQFPAFSQKELSSGLFMSKFDSYSMDQFPLRDGFRSFKAVCSKYIFAQKDNNGIYSVEGYLSSLEYPLNQTHLNQAIQKINEMQELYLDGTGCSVYLSLIPDKNCFLAPLGGYPCIDFHSVADQVTREVSQPTYIDISDLIALSDFYRTDQHWRQECITDVADRISVAMTGQHVDTSSYLENTLDRPFYGVYVGQSALPADADTIHYLSSAGLSECIVTDYSSGSPVEGSIYDMEKAYGRDAYDLFMGGSTPLLVIENPRASSGRELVVFRDSFGSSLIPLLVEQYQKITVVDLRYIRSDFLGRFISFENQDVLFLYSSLILNHSISMN